MARISDLTVNGDTHLLGNTYGTLSGTVNGKLNGRATNADLADEVNAVSTISGDKLPVLFKKYSDNKIYYQPEEELWYSPNSFVLHSHYFDGDLKGNAATASKLSTPRTINFTGNVTGSASFDGSSNVSINTKVSEAAHAQKATNADELNGYSATDLFRHLSGSQAPASFVDIFDRPGTIDMTTMNAADKATHKANINKARNASQNIWNTDAGIYAYGGDYDMSNGYSHGALKLTQSYKNFDKVLIMGCNDDGNLVVPYLWDVWELAYMFANSYRFFLFSSDHDFWIPYGTTKHGNATRVWSTDTIWNCENQNSGIIAIYGIKF